MRPDLVRENWNGLLVPPRDVVVSDVGDAKSCRPTGALCDHGREQCETYCPLFAEGLGERDCKDGGSRSRCA